MIVDNALYRGGTRVGLGRTTADLVGGREDQGGGAGPADFVWVELLEPTEEEAAAVAERYGMHHLAVEDALRAHQRPKLERYDDALFMVLKTLWYVDAQDAVETGEIALFVTDRAVVTVRHGEGTSLRESRRRLEGDAALLAHGPTAVVHAVCDDVVDRYEEVAAALVEDVDEIETSVFSEERTDDGARIYTLKRELAEVRRAVLPLRDPMARFASGSGREVHPDAAHYFRDVADHLARVSDTVDTLDALLSTAFEAHLAQISIRQNEDMRKISAVVGLVGAPTLVAGIYGMNFAVMPELHWTLGYPMALGLMAASVAGVWLVCRRAGWF